MFPLFPIFLLIPPANTGIYDVAGIIICQKVQQVETKTKGTIDLSPYS